MKCINGVSILKDLSSRSSCFWNGIPEKGDLGTSPRQSIFCVGGEFGYLIFRISNFGTLSTGLVEYPCIAYYWLLGSVVTGDLVEFRVNFVFLRLPEPATYLSSMGQANYRLGSYLCVHNSLKKRGKKKAGFWGQGGGRV